MILFIVVMKKLNIMKSMMTHDNVVKKCKPAINLFARNLGGQLNFCVFFKMNDIFLNI